jgi:hypothetical protein
MAEKNTESTAVNQLIELVATAQPLPPDPDEDLMFRPVSAKKMEPLPRARSPLGTQQGLQTVKQEVAHTIRQVPPGVRITTPSRSMTIPPMTLDHDEDAEVTNPGPSTFTRPTTQGVAAQPRATGSNAARLSGVHATLPPPVPTLRPSSPPPPPSPAMTMRASAPPIPYRPSSQPTSDFSYPVLPSLPPKTRAASMPAVAPAEELLADDSAVPSWIERDVGTQSIKRSDWKTIAGKLIGPMVVLVIAGIFIGGYFAFDGDGGKQRTPPKATEGDKVAMAVTPPAPAPAAAAAPAPAPVEAPKPAAPAAVTPPNLAASTPEPAKAVEPAKPAAPSTGRPTLVDVRIDSNPSGATVMLIDRGKQTFLGTTPMSAAVDTSRKYELVFSYEGRATVVESLDPASQQKLSVKLSRANAPAPRVAAPKIAAPPKKSGIDAALESAEKPAPAKIEKASGGDGTLMISSKPPCEIFVDGKPTGLTTPQRAIMLPAGAHKITLVNTAEGIKKTVSVQITADKPTKVIQDFMK